MSDKPVLQLVPKKEEPAAQPVTPETILERLLASHALADCKSIVLVVSRSDGNVLQYTNMGLSDAYHLISVGQKLTMDASLGLWRGPIIPPPTPA